jgi:hypothetical protein
MENIILYQIMNLKSDYIIKIKIIN